ncbi:MAG: type II toxin-antitoxin system Phd/YefM family antitoxin [Leptospirales bacterium]
MNMPAAEFKSKCLKIMDDVNAYHQEVVITKHGKPVAKLVPYSNKPSKSIFGYMKDTVAIYGDITKPLEENWDADQ